MILMWIRIDVNFRGCDYKRNGRPFVTLRRFIDVKRYVRDAKFETPLDSKVIRAHACPSWPLELLRAIITVSVHLKPIKKLLSWGFTARRFTSSRKPASEFFVSRPYLCFERQLSHDIHILTYISTCIMHLYTPTVLIYCN